MRYRNILGLFAGVLAGFMISDMAVSAAPAKEEPLAVLYSASDFQNMEGHEQGAKVLEGITNQIYVSGHKDISEAMICGDYYYDDTISEEESENGIKAVYQVLNEQWGLDHEDIYFVQGNHDPNRTKGLDSTGPTEREFYSVYQINHNDFICDHQYGIDHETRIRETSEELVTWLEEKIKSGDSRPIFIISHLPLHHSYRYDNLYAEYIFDAINKAGEQGLNIVYLFGHNHSSEYDKYLGGGAIYLTKGDEIIIPDIQGETEEDYKMETLHFVYMNAGYIGEAADEVISSCIFEIYDDHLKIKRYTQEGEYDLKQSGISSEQDLGWEANLITRSTPQIVKLNKTIISWAEEFENETILINPKISKDLAVDIQGVEKISVNWECSNTDILDLKTDQNNSSKACITGKKYGTVTVTAIARKLSDGEEIAKAKIKVLITPENAVCLSYGEYVKFYKYVPDLKVELQDFIEEEREFIISNSNQVGVRKILSAQNDDYMGTEKVRVLFVPGVGTVIAENRDKNILWHFEQIEGMPEDVQEYQIQLSKKSLYRYRYYIAAAWGVDSSLGHPNITNMRTCSENTSSGAAAFYLDSENINSLKTTHHYKERWKENDQGTFTLIFDADNQEFALSNQKEGPVSFFGRTQNVISDILMWTDAASGKATIESTGDAATGGVIYVMHENTIEEVPITLEMLSGFDNSVPGKYACTLSFNGETLSENYELTIQKENFDFVKMLKSIMNLLFN